MRSLRVVLLVFAIASACTDSTKPVPTESGIVYSFSPSGSERLARDLFLLSADGGTSRSLVTSSEDKILPSWSPDGRTLAYYQSGGSDGGAWLANADGTNARRIPGVDGVPRWSPDGSWIIFIDYDERNIGGIDVVHPDGTGRHRLTSGVSGILIGTIPSWSVGGRIAFGRDNGIGFGAGNIWTMNEDGSDLTQVTHGSREEMPLWSPDGVRLAFTFVDPTLSASPLAVMNADGSGRRVLTLGTEPSDVILDAWSPDGRWLLYHIVTIGYPHRSCGYFKVPVDGGASVSPPIPLPFTNESCGGASWR